MRWPWPWPFCHRNKAADDTQKQQIAQSMDHVLATTTRIEATISLTMTLAQWQTLRVSVTSDHLYEPGGKLRQAIDDLVRQATKAFYPVEVEPS